MWKKALFRTMNRVSFKYPLLMKRHHFLSKNALNVSISALHCNHSMKGSIHNDEHVDELEMSEDIVEQCPTFDYITNILYPTSEDPVMLELKDAPTPLVVLEILRKRKGQLTPQHHCQAILVLRHLQTRSSALNVCSNSLTDVVPNIYHLLNDSVFIDLLRDLEYNCNDLDLEELSCCILYLHKFSVPVENQTMQKLIDRFEVLMNEMEVSSIPLDVLARFCIAVKSQGGLWSIYTLLKFMNIISQRLECCSDYNDFRHLTVCLQKSVPLLSKQTMDLYLRKCAELCDSREKDCEENAELESERVRTVVKAVTFLNFSVWDGKFVPQIKSMLTSLIGGIKYIPMQEMLNLYHNVSRLQEPVQLLREMRRISTQWMYTYGDVNQNPHLILMCHLPSPLTNQQIRKIESDIMNNLRRVTNSALLKSFMSNLYYMLYSLPLNKEISNAFWERTTNMLPANVESNDIARLLWISNRYRKFCLHHTGYHYAQFEKTVSSLLVRTLYSDYGDICSPSIFAKMMSFAMSMAEPGSKMVFCESLVERLKSTVLRLGVGDCLLLSHGLRVAMEKTNRRNPSPDFYHYYVELISAINSRAWDYLSQNENISPDELNESMLAYNLRKGIKNSHLFAELIRRYHHVPMNSIHTKWVRDAIRNMSHCNYMDTVFVGKVTDYITLLGDKLHGTFIGDALYYAYNYGLVSEKFDEVLGLAEPILDRDKRETDGLKLIRCALATCFYGKPSIPLIRHIFDVGFLENLDDEMKRVKKGFGSKVRGELMRLNRSVCIEFPEFNIPWFHADYCKAIATLDDSITQPLRLDVVEVLTNLVKDKKYVQMNHYSPYGHKIDFLIHLNKRGDLILPQEATPTSTRVAILLDQFNSSKEHFAGKGQQIMDKRQLEILNYKVVPLKDRFWNAMFMSEPTTKFSHLKAAIWS